MDVRTWISRQVASHERKDREEAERFRAMTAEQRSEVLRSLSSAAMRAVLSLPDDQRKRALEHRDPLPESSIRAWSRLRKSYGSSAARR